MLSIRNTKTTPKEKWRYPRVDGTEIVESSYMNLRREIATHYRGMGMEAPSEEEINRWICENISVHCFDGREEFRNRYTDPPALHGMGSTDWPFILKPFKLLAKEGDRGLGDIAARVIGPVGGDAYKTWHLKTFGKPCGCGERQNSLNIDYPL